MNPARPPPNSTKPTILVAFDALQSPVNSLFYKPDLDPLQDLLLRPQLLLSLLVGAAALQALAVLGPRLLQGFLQRVMKKRGRPLSQLELTAAEKQSLEQTIRRRGAGHMEVLRAKVILWAADGLSNTEIVRRTHLSPPTVGKWRKRFLQNRTAGLSELPRSGAPRRIDDEQIQRVITETLESKPQNSTHWSTRTTMAKRCGLSRQAVNRIWRAFGLKPHRSESFTLSTDPLFVEKVRDVVGLYLDPPRRL